MLKNLLRAWTAGPFCALWRRRRHVRRQRLWTLLAITAIYLIHVYRSCFFYHDRTREPQITFEDVPRSSNVWVTLPKRRATRDLPARLPADRVVGKVFNLSAGPVPEGAIHFVVTTLAPNLALKARDMCAFESAARLHPDKAVVVSIMSPAIFVDLTLSQFVKAYPNVAFLTLDLKSFLQGTPLEVWFRNASGLEKSPVAVGWLSDLSRVSLLYKYGGWYLDCDQITLKRFTNLRNSIPTEYFEIYPNGNFMAFDKGHQILLENMETVVTSIKQDDWNTTKQIVDLAGAYRWAKMGPFLWKNIIIDKGWCKTKFCCWPMTRMDFSSCDKGVRVLPSSSFSPIWALFLPWRLFTPATPSAVATAKHLLRNAYGIHFHNAYMKDYRVQLRPGFVITNILAEACPVVTKMSGDEM